MTDLFQDSVDTTVDIKDPLEHLIGQGGKFYDPDRDTALRKMAIGKIEADRTIEQRNRENTDLRQDLFKTREQMNATANLQALIDQMKEQQQQPLTSNNEPPVKEAPALDLSKIEEIVQSSMLKKSQADREAANFSQVQNKLKETWGDNFSKVLEQRKDTLGLSTEFVNNLAKTSPDAFYRTFEVMPKLNEQFQTPPTTQRRTDPFAPTVEKRTWSWYQKKRNESPAGKTWYNDPKTVVQMHKDYITLGKEFEDGTFKI